MFTPPVVTDETPIDPLTLSPSVLWDSLLSTTFQWASDISSVAKGDTTGSLTTAGAFSWGSPTVGSSTVTLEGWGGGASGVGDDGFAQGGPGGGGGDYGIKAAITMTAWADYPGKVGAGGAATGSGVSNENGGDTSVSLEGFYEIGGGFGTGPSIVTPSGFTTTFTGGFGGGATSTGGAGGGGSGGTAANGNSGSNSASSTGGAGAAAVAGGAGGGAGGDAGKGGTAGQTPGGGGGGAGFGGGNSGAGGNGKVRFTFTNSRIKVEGLVSNAPNVERGASVFIWGNSVAGYNGLTTVVYNDVDDAGANAIVDKVYSSSTGASGKVAYVDADTVGDQVAFIEDLSTNDNHLTVAPPAEDVFAYRRASGLSGTVIFYPNFVLENSFTGLAAFTAYSVLRRAVATIIVTWYGNSGADYIRVNANGTLTVKVGTTTFTTTGTITLGQSALIGVRLSGGTLLVRATGGLNESTATAQLADVEGYFNGSDAGETNTHRAASFWNSALTDPQFVGVAAWYELNYGVGF